MVDETISQERDRNISKAVLSFVVLDMMKVYIYFKLKKITLWLKNQDS